MSWSLATGAAVRALDAHTIEVLGVPSLVLMETAARAIALEVCRRYSTEMRKGVCVVAGRGNNAGDGYALARLLHVAGVPVRVLALPGPMSRDGALNRRAAEGVGVPVAEEGAPSGGLLVDALFGTGLDRPVEGLAAERVGAINASGAPVVAVDMPSGICSDSGRVLGVAVRADCTVTFDRPRWGQVLEPGVDHCGALVVVDIGLRGDCPVDGLCYEGAEIAALLPGRAAGSHKNQHGHLAVVAGSPERAGAAVLVASAAMRAGAGLVTLFLPREALPRLGGLPPEVMLRFDPPSPEALGSFSALAVGPGVGTGCHELAQLRAIWHDAAPPAVFDADGLTALAEDPAPSRAPRCITPHPGEARRLLPGCDAADRVAMARGLSAFAPALLKGRHTLIATQGAPLVLNRTGGPMLATAGSGDVLTGLVGALLARGLSPRDALVAGAFVHGYAGELAGDAPVLASEVVARLPEALRTVAHRPPVFQARGLLEP